MSKAEEAFRAVAETDGRQNVTVAFEGKATLELNSCPAAPLPIKYVENIPQGREPAK